MDPAVIFSYGMILVLHIMMALCIAFTVDERYGR